MRTLAARASVLGLAASVVGCRNAPAPASDRTGWLAPGIGRLPTGASLDPVGASTAVGAMPLGAVLSPSGKRLVLSLGGWRVQGIQVVDRAEGRVVQTLRAPSAFVGIIFARDGHELFASGGNEDVVYRYRWAGDTAVLTDSIRLAPEQKGKGTRYPAGLALSPDGRTLYVAENLGDAIAVVDVATGRVRERYATPRYPYAVVAAPDGQVFVSVWTGSQVLAYTARSDGTLADAPAIAVGRHPSALLLNRDGTRLFCASASTDRVSVIDTRAHRVVAQLLDPPPAAVEGSTPNAMALSDDEQTLFVAEADNNSVATYGLSAATSGRSATRQARDTLVGRIPVGWYPTALVVANDTLFVANGKGTGTHANPDGPSPAHERTLESRSYTLGQLEGSLTILSAAASMAGATIASYSARVAHANGWDTPTTTAVTYPPFEHVIYVIKENRTYDQVFGDLSQADGDTSLLFFPRAVSPNHHALAERFGIFDRFFVNAEASPDGHNWSTAAYATDYLEKTLPAEYSSRGRTYDYEGTNRGFSAANIPDDDVASPANGYLWDAAARAHVSMRNYGEFVVREEAPAAPQPGAAAKQVGVYRGDKVALRGVTNASYPGFDLTIRDQVRADVWLVEFANDVRSGQMPQLEIVRLPNDHTAGMRAGSPTPRAMMADNDLALGRMVEAVSKSPYWKSTVFFVLEDDAQNGPDHVDSHRSVLLVISAYNKGGVTHRWVNTTDVVATMLEILHAPHLSSFDTYSRPLREIWTNSANATPFARLQSAVDSTERNPSRGTGARQSGTLDLSREDAADEDTFNRVLWLAMKGRQPYPSPHPSLPLEWKRGK
jgi:DNA-binding beta-propeller fold protein YncE